MLLFHLMQSQEVCSATTMRAMRRRWFSNPEVEVTLELQPLTGEVLMVACATRLAGTDLQDFRLALLLNPLPTNLKFLSKRLTQTLSTAAASVVAVCLWQTQATSAIMRRTISRTSPELLLTVEAYHQLVLPEAITIVGLVGLSEALLVAEVAYSFPEGTVRASAPD